MSLDDIAKVFTSASGALSSGVTILTILAGLVPHFNWKLMPRLQREARRLEEIDKISSYSEQSSSSSKSVKQNKSVSPAEEMAYSTYRNQISEKICWLLFASRTNDLQNKKKYWGIGCPSPIVSLLAAILIVFPAASLATMAKKPNNTGVVCITYVFTVGWLVIVLLGSALYWWALRRDFFREELHCNFTESNNKSKVELESDLSEAIDKFARKYGSEQFRNKSRFAWLAVILFGVTVGVIFYTGQWGWLFSMIIVPICCVVVTRGIKKVRGSDPFMLLATLMVKFVAKRAVIAARSTAKEEAEKAFRKKAKEGEIEKAAKQEIEKAGQEKIKQIADQARNGSEKVIDKEAKKVAEKVAA